MLRKELARKKLPVRHSCNLKSRSKVKHNCKSHKKGRPPKKWTDDCGTSEHQHCVICLDTQKLKVHKKVLCGHTFHNTCIKRWLENATSCPICRKPAMLSGEEHQDDHMQLQNDYIQLKYDYIQLQIERIELQIERIQLELERIRLKLELSRLRLKHIRLRLTRLQILHELLLFEDLGPEFDYTSLKLYPTQQQFDHLFQQELCHIWEEFRNIEQENYHIQQEIHNLRQQQDHIRQELRHI